MQLAFAAVALALAALLVEWPLASWENGQPVLAFFILCLVAAWLWPVANAPISRWLCLRSAAQASDWTLQELDAIGLFHGGQPIAIASLPARIPQWTAQVVYLLVHPQGQARLRHGKYSASMGHTGPNPLARKPRL